MHGQILSYVTLIIIKSLCPKCLIFKSSSGEYFAVKNIKLPSKCWNGKIFRSSDSQILYCMESQTAKHDSIHCVLDDSLIINSRDENKKDYNDYKFTGEMLVVPKEQLPEGSVHRRKVQGPRNVRGPRDPRGLQLYTQ